MISHLVHFPGLVPLLLSLAALAAARSVSTALASRIGTAAVLAGFALGAAPLLLPAAGPQIASPRALFELDTLSRPLLAYVTLCFGCVFLAAPRVDREPASVSRLLLIEALSTALFSTRDPVLMAALWAAAAVPVWAILRECSPTASRVFAAYAAASSALFVLGVLLGAGSSSPSLPAVALIALAVMARKGVVPLHSWVPVLFESAPLSTALAFTMPQAGAYALMRLVVPVTAVLSRGPLAIVSGAALLTSLYSAALASVQREARRALACVLMSQFALVLAGLNSVTAAGLTGALTMWISSGLALTGFGLALRMLEARRGKLRLDVLQGGYERMPLLAATFCFLGMASVGFPGTLGFVAEDLLLRGTSEHSPHVSIGIVLAAALNGITLLRAYLVLFCGTRDRSRFQMALEWRESAALLALVAVLLVTGLVPAPVVVSRGLAARQALSGDRGHPTEPDLSTAAGIP